MATSGTVSLTTFETRKVIDHAARRCKILPQQVVPEHIETANDLLFLFLSHLANRGVPLWVIDRSIIPIYRNQRSVPLPRGTVDVMNFNIRRLARPLGTNTATEGVAANAFDADTDTACTQTSMAGNIRVQHASAIQINTFGILFNATATWDISIQGSQDGAVWTTLYTNAALAAVDGEWFWVDLDQQIPWEYHRLLANGTTVLDVSEFYLGSSSNEIPMPKINRDDYANLPDKTFPSRPTEYWYDKQSATSAGIQIATVWPVPDAQFTFYQYVIYIKRHIHDVGTMRQELELPQGWYLAVVAELARHLCREIKEADDTRIPMLDADAAQLISDAWANEGDGSPVRLNPGIGVYTR